MEMFMDRVWFITGTSSGFGREIATAALGAGDRVVATARQVSGLADLVERAPDHVRAVALDVTDPAAVCHAVDVAVAEFGRIDVVVNNAGYGSRGALEELSDEQIRAQFDVNVFGVLDVLRAVLPVMRAQRSGHVVQMSSVGGVGATLGGAAYAATKFALEGLSEGLALEVAPLGIRVTLVEPGPFRTDFAGRSAAHGEPIEDYAPILDPARERFLAQDGRQPGDPRRAAQAVVDLVGLEDPPLRLPLGGAAFDRLRARLGARLADLDAVEPLGRDTDFPTAGE
jgi:NAD(P)-dependent dehydrogenase (short-subunit alcohol dehydrogenase family)